MTRTCLWLAILIAWGNAASAAVLTVRGTHRAGDTQATLEVVLATSQGEEVAAIQNDLVFDPDGIHLAMPSSCMINPEISDRAAGCESDVNSGPCKQLSRVLDDVDDEQRFRGLILSLSNTTTIPDGVLYTCSVEVPFVLDDVRLPTCPNAQASDPDGGAIDLPCVVDLSRFMVRCGEASSQVIFSGMEVRPARPQVGDDVELIFSVDARVYSRLGMFVTQSPELLADLQPDGVVFRGRAVQAGRSNVRLGFTYGTENFCESIKGERYFTPSHMSRTAFSPDYELVIAEAPSPTPTWTPVGDPPSFDDNDEGCQVRKREARATGLSWVFLLVPAALAVRCGALKRSRPKASGGPL